MNFEDKTRGWPYGSGIVLQMRAIGRADLDQRRPGTLHDFRQPKRTADFNKLSAGNHGLAVQRKRVQYQQHGSGIVVDDGGILRAGEFAEQSANVLIALATLSMIQVIFERDR